jgi:nitrous oxidase accessory protein NosD
VNRKSAAILLIAFLAALTTTETQLTKLVNANFIVSLPTITIRRDGTVEPETEYIKQTGNTYTLTANLLRKYAVIIKCNNIVFDGGGFVIDGSIEGKAAQRASGYANNGLFIEKVSNVTVKDLTVTGFMNKQFWVHDCYNSSFIRIKGEVDFQRNDFCIITQSEFTGVCRSLTDNVITKSNISGINIESSAIALFENNFLHSFRVMYGAVTWDNGSIGNYWSDYLKKYPNASEIGNTGIGDTPYVIDANNVDNYPLMVPFQQLPAPTPHPTEPTQDAEPFPTAIVAGATGALAIIAASLGFVYYKRKSIVNN